MLEEAAPGIAEAEVAAEMLGVHRIVGEDHTAFAVVGRLNPPELADMRATGERLAPIGEATGGSVRWLREGGIPEVRHVAAGANSGSDWIGLRQTGGYRVVGVRQGDVLHPLALLIALLALAATVWRREGR
jgi:hypothetical protein